MSVFFDSNMINSWKIVIDGVHHVSHIGVLCLDLSVVTMDGRHRELRVVHKVVKRAASRPTLAKVMRRNEWVLAGSESSCRLECNRSEWTSWGAWSSVGNR